LKKNIKETESKSNIDIPFNIFISIIEWLHTNTWNKPSLVTNKLIYDSIISLHTLELLPIFKDTHNVGEPVSFQLIFNANTYSDITLIVEGKQIYAHKVILALRNDKFRAMFDSNFKESTQKELLIENFSYNITLLFIKYLYTDTVGITIENVFELLECANYYNCTQLLRKCEIFIISTVISTDCILNVYQYGLKYMNQTLIQACETFISYRHEKIALQSDFNLLSEDKRHYLSSIKKKRQLANRLN